MYLKGQYASREKPNFVDGNKLNEVYGKGKRPLKDQPIPESSSIPRPGTAPSKMLRKLGNLTDQPQVIAKGEMASAVAVQKDAKATVSVASKVLGPDSPYLAAPQFPDAIRAKTAQNQQVSNIYPS